MGKPALRDARCQRRTRNALRTSVRTHSSLVQATSHPRSRVKVHDGLRLYLSEGICANTLFRLLTNLQHRYDARAEAVSANGTIA